MCGEYLWNSEISSKDAELQRMEGCMSTGHTTFRMLEFGTDVFYACFLRNFLVENWLSNYF